MKAVSKCQVSGIGCAEKEVEIMEDSKLTVSPDTTALIHIWTHRYWQHTTRHAQVQSRQDPITKWEKWTCGSTPHQEAIWNWYQLARGKSVCFNGFLYINQTQGKISYPRISSQHKTNSMVVCFLLFHFVLPEHFCLIWVFCLFVFGFSLLCFFGLFFEFGLYGSFFLF